VSSAIEGTTRPPLVEAIPGAYPWRIPKPRHVVTPEPRHPSGVQVTSAVPELTDAPPSIGLVTTSVWAAKMST